MRCVYTRAHLRHVPGLEVQHGETISAYEVPDRVEVIRSALEADGSFDLVDPVGHGTEPVAAVHDARMVRFLEAAWNKWDAARPGSHPLADMFLHARLRDGMEEATEPQGMSGALGFWCFDSSTPLGAGSYEAALAAVDVALTAADLVLAGDPLAYGLCRPPGHHAAAAAFGGYCFLNNAAIAAHYMGERTEARIAVLDVDYHHGNGTQQIFYRRGDVYVASLHADPQFAYPYYTGFTHETGAGAGEGTTLNLPLDSGCDGSRYMAALARALEALSAFDPHAVVVSLGLDTYRKDPIADFVLTTDDLAEMGRRVAGFGRPLVIVQEGGYHVDSLGKNALAWLCGAREGAG